MKPLAIAILLSTFAACAGGDPQNADPGNNGTSNGENNGVMGCQDLDGDGFDGRAAGCNLGTDCDDNSAQIKPTATEVCGDRIDNNCNGTTDEDCDNGCVDADGDRYGVGGGCFGLDCDDANPAINPSAIEVCGNNIDEDCMNGDLVCPENCIDNDGDGYGAAGSTDCTDANGQILTEVDCDDTNAAINPTANEVCDTFDNNCDGQEDECPLAGQACTQSGGTCQGGSGAECENADDCAGTFLTCDPSQSPKVCKVAEDGPCQASGDCVDGLSCENNVCVGNFCATDPCSGEAPYDVCHRAAGICVECPFFDTTLTFAEQDAACEAGQSCVAGGWCAYADWICHDSATEPCLFETTTIAPENEEAFWINQLMALCWLDTRPAGIKKMCSAIWVSSDAITLTEDLAKDAYVDGLIDGELYMDENEALDDIWGEGFFNRKEIDWKQTPQPGSAQETCLWYQPGNLFKSETLVLDKCENFTP